MYLTFMQLPNTATSQILSSRVQCSNATQMQCGVNEPQMDGLTKPQLSFKLYTGGYINRPFVLSYVGTENSFLTDR